VAYRGGLFLRTGDVDDPNLKALYSAPSAPPIQYYLSPALTADVGVGFKIGSASFLTLSLVGVIESAGNDFRSKPGESLLSLGGALPEGAPSMGLPSAAYHYASGPQYLIGPELAFRFGP
jgi:hypothetical protein